MAGFTLRNIPEPSLQIAHRLCKQTGQSMNDVLRQAIVSGLLIEATKLAPGPDGLLSGLTPDVLAKALRRQISSAIDLLLEHQEHPYQMLFGQEHHHTVGAPSQQQRSQSPAEHAEVSEGTIGDDLDALGLGAGLSAHFLDHA